ncbi:uncharacterized protein BXZ73DRAFT_88701 [Epithele typhae]|uniref:uncharacterized protein n=1 Tax=Epithele typhae TaxID=378194 RepID=UPI0020080E15|nr:uncharacterized protein BXZ73DRAFT_88701 [Epithele typhae]KAH9940461.1 hypothetical protein BXZ73DRAFT_88701 [Epithele typhae]
MAYNYYQTQHPGWGTSQFQFGAPPVPAFQPQPSWRGYDYYNAYASNPEPGFFDTIMGRVRDFMGVGVSRQDCRHWHNKIYSGQTCLPADVGAAAAYEAYRTMKHNSFLYEPLSADRERQREALTGMAVAETQRLWQFASRHMDHYGLDQACETAAAAATMLADRLFTSMGGLARSNSYSSLNEAYAYDDPYRHHGRRSRRNSFTSPTVVRVGGSPHMGSMPLGYGQNSVPMAGTTPSYVPGVPGSYGYASPLDGRASPGPYGAPGVVPSAGYTYNGMPVGGYAGSAPYGGIPGAPYSSGGTVPPGSTVVIQQGHRSRRHSTASSHGHHHHHPQHSYSGSSRRELDREREAEYERELEARDWERADRERHERDRRRWEESQRYGADDYGRYGRMGSLGSSPSGYGYSDRY